MGWNTGDLRLPLTSMEEGTLNQLKTAMKNYGLI